MVTGYYNSYYGHYSANDEPKTVSYNGHEYRKKESEKDWASESDEEEPITRSPDSELSQKDEDSKPKSKPMFEEKQAVKIEIIPPEDIDKGVLESDGGVKPIPRAPMKREGTVDSRQVKRWMRQAARKAS